MKRLLKYMILYNPEDNNFTVYDGVTDKIKNLPVVGIRKVTTETDVLKNNEIGVYNNKLAVGDGSTSFKDLDTYPSMSSITQEISNSKVDKIEGKGLSSNDFTDELKSKLESIDADATPVSFTQSLTSGTKIGDLTINGETISLYSTNNTVYNVATTTSDGLMSSSDKIKLDSIDPDGVSYTHPTYDATTGSEVSNQTPNFGESLNLSQVITDITGHVTSQTTRTITIPDTKASSSGFGIIKVGTNLSVDEGTISLSNNDVLNALNKGSDTTKYLRNDGNWTVPYTHPTYNTTQGSETSDQSPNFGETVTISQVTTDANGHVISQTTRTITIPNTIASTTTAGLMSASDKTTLDTLASSSGGHSAYAAFVAPNDLSNL